MSFRVITDPLGNVVYLPSSYHLKNFSADCLDEDIALIIKNPAIIITLLEPNPALYHYRSVGWDLVLMFKSVKQQNHWVVTDCIKSPCFDTLKKLLQEGEMITFAD